jgi:phenylacetate-CoA ligase
MVDQAREENSDVYFSTLFWNIYSLYHGTGSWFRDLENFRTMSPNAARKDLASRLLRQIQYFGSRDDAFPEWRDAAKIKDPEDLWRVWPDLPIVTKQDLQNSFRPEEIKKRFNVDGLITSTGGSTGEPTWFLHDTLMCQASKATSIYCKEKVGWKKGMPVIVVWGSERDIAKQQSPWKRVPLRLANIYLLDAYEINSSTVDRVLEIIDKHSPVAMYGFSSMLEYVAKEVASRSDHPSPGSVAAAWNGGEMLYEDQSEAFRQAFGIPLLNYYGGRELSSMAYQPHVGSPLIVLRPLLFLEIVDNNGKPVSPGDTGRLIWTSTVCRGTPFIRFDVGDVGTYGAADRDESGIKVIRELQGRFAGLLKLPNGKLINCIFWNHLLKEFPEVEQFQVVLYNEKAIHFRLKGQPFEQNREQEFRRILTGLLSSVPVTISWVNRIPLTSQGKLIQVVRESSPDEGST